ncbi:MAG: LpxI family protein [Desulfovibrionales bacterium]|nr:LpxI family protein [Desulfovibrionales bacterium]
MAQTLGIIAGGGFFPITVAQSARAVGMRVVGVGFTSDTDPSFPKHCDTFCWLKLGQLSKLIAFFHKHGAEQVAMAGPINKPRALDIRPDWRAAKLLFSLSTKGDDAILRALLRELEREGFVVVSAQSFVPDLAAPAGILTHRAPSTQEYADIVLGWKITQALGSFDVGQCVILREGIVLAIEALEGTDAAIARAGSLGGSGAVVVKRPKPGQEHRVDLPAVGLQTIERMRHAGATCLAIEAGHCLFFDRSKATDLANSYGIAVVSQNEFVLTEENSVSSV